MTALMEKVRDARRGVFAKRPMERAWEWAERCVEIHDGENAENVGHYSTTLTPYVREFIDCFEDPAVTDVALCKGSQVGFTLAIQVGVAWRMRHEPGGMLWVMPTQELARDFSETRWQPLLKGSAEVSDLVPDDADRMKLLHQRLLRGWIRFVGSNSPGNLASWPVPLLVCDEVDKFAPATAKEAHALDLAEQRTKKFAGAKRIKISSPTTENGTIWKEYLKGDQRKFYMPCPHCGESILFEWRGVKWDQEARKGEGWDLERVKRSARFECPECEGKITDSLKLRMLPLGEWRPTVVGAPGFRSYHLSSLYAPWASCSWGSLAVSFLLAKEHYDLQGFMNGGLAEPWTLEAEKVEPVEMMVRREEYGEGLPGGVLCLVAGVDVQDDRLEAEIIGWGAGAENWGIETRVFWGDPGRGPVWSALDLWLLHDRGMPVAATGIDTGGHHAGDVYRYCRPRLGRRVFAMKGANVRWRPTVTRKPSRNNKLRCPLWLVGTDTAKALWFAWLRGVERGPGYCHFPMEYDEEFFRQLAAEELRTRKIRGYEVREFHKVRDRNEALDFRVYALAALEIIGGMNMLEVLAARRKKDERKGLEKEVVDEVDAGFEQNRRRPNRPRGGSFVSGW